MTYQPHQAEDLALKTAHLVEDVPLAKFHELTGITAKAVYHKIARGIWMEGFEFHRSATGAISVHLPGYRRWARGLDRQPATVQH